MQLGELGEFRFIDRIRRRAGSCDRVVRGIGDDAAELSLPASHNLLTSTDLLIEHIHFRFDWISPEHLGRKAVAVNLSDLAAMGATPRFLYLGLACPAGTEVDQLEGFLDGVLAECATFGVCLVGGDTCRSPGPWMISVTVEGSAPAGQSIGRSAAAPGEILMVSGTLGDSALALALLQQGQTVDPFLLQRHVTPTPRVALGQALAAGKLASAMIDISDGLTADLQHLLRASGVSADIELNALPLSAAFRAYYAEQPQRIDLALHGGEDYELLFSVARNAEAEVCHWAAGAGVAVTRIGSLKPGPATLEVLDIQGVRHPVAARGYDHFSEPAPALVAPGP